MRKNHITPNTLHLIPITRRLKGFTLIELLVVIAIIIILAAVLLVSLSSARRKARDAQRVTDVENLQKALALYADDNNGTYPTAAQMGNLSGSWARSYAQSGTTDSWAGILMSPERYINVAPRDPSQPNPGTWVGIGNSPWYGYISGANPGGACPQFTPPSTKPDYYLMFWLERGSNKYILCRTATGGAGADRFNRYIVFP